ncbi:MAG: Ig-like domain-containing protein [Bacteroidota bacterium]
MINSPPVIILSPKIASVITGSTLQLTAYGIPRSANINGLKWSSDNTLVATVSSTGLVAGVKAGSANITVSTPSDSIKMTCAIKVSDLPISVSSVTMSPTISLIGVGRTAQLRATITPVYSTNKNVIWRSNNKDIVTVSSTGMVTGVIAGTATITITTVDGRKTASGTVTVSYNKPESGTTSYVGKSVLPSDTIKANLCARIVNIYISDINRYYDTITNYAVEQLFLKKIGECLTCIADDTSAFRKMSDILQRILLPPSKIVNAIVDNPVLLNNVLEALTDSGKNDALSSFTSWLMNDSLKVKEFWNILDNESRLRLCEGLALQLKEHPSSTEAVNRFLEIVPFEKLQPEIVEKLGIFFTKYYDTRFTMAVLDSINKYRDESDIDNVEQKSKMLSLYKSLAKEKLSYQNIANFCRKVKQIQADNENKKSFMLLRVNILSPKSLQERDTVFWLQFNETFSPLYQTEYLSKRSDQKKNIRSIFKMDPTGSYMDIPNISDSLINHSVLVFDLMYDYNERADSLIVIANIADARNSMLLFSEKLEMDKVNKNLTKDVNLFFQGIVTDFQDNLISATTLDSLISKYPTLSPDKLMAQNYLGFTFGYQYSDNFFDMPIHTINTIYLKSPFWNYNPEFQKKEIFRETLQKKLVKYYPQKLLTSIDFKDLPTTLSLAGKFDIQNPGSTKIYFTMPKRDDKGRQVDDTLSYLYFNFRSNSSFEENEERITDIVSNQTRIIVPVIDIPPEKFPKPGIPVAAWKTFPSFLLAGSSQLLLAENLGIKKTVGFTFAIAQLSTIGLAAYYNNMAIRNVSNAYIDRRNNALYAATGIAITSGIHALIKIHRHNKPKKS